MTTELVEGTTLAQRLELGALRLEDALCFFSQLLSGLGHAHLLGVVHRDITPSNIVLTPDGRVKLTGFALAKAASDPQLTQPGTVMGSLNYISPEQVKGLSEIDKRSDIYSLGVVLYEALTGRRPFQHEEPVRGDAGARQRESPGAQCRKRQPPGGIERYRFESDGQGSRVLVFKPRRNSATPWTCWEERPSGSPDGCQARCRAGCRACADRGCPARARGRANGRPSCRG